jgi:hypothetical protein
MNLTVHPLITATDASVPQSDSDPGTPAFEMRVRFIHMLLMLTQFQTSPIHLIHSILLN